jgi:hypothetical protein
MDPNLEKKEKRCPHLPSIEEESKMLDMRDAILVCQQGQNTESVSELMSRRVRKILKSSTPLVKICIHAPISQLAVLFRKLRYAFTTLMGRII